ncbi:MAG: PEGA domain-containing protein [Gemmata sp.]
MTTARPGRLAALAVILTAGCGGVDRRFVVESNVPGAQVFIDNRPVGAAPAHASFEYYGHYTIKLVHPGYETVEKRVRVAAPWYAYPPFDFLVEVLWPLRVRDTRKQYFELFEATQTRTDDILNAADALRLRGQALHPPERPAEPRSPKGQPARPPGAGSELVPSVVPSVQP